MCVQFMRKKMNNTENLNTKYQPKSINDLILSKRIKLKIEAIIKNNNAQNYIFYSKKTGTGKTSVAKIVSAVHCRSQFVEESNQVEVIECSQKRHRSIEAIESLKHRSSRFCATRNVFILDEADSLTAPAKESLSSLMNEREKIQFILTTNNIESFPKKLLSRCLIIDFEPDSSVSALINRLEYIFNNELDSMSEKDRKAIRAIAIENQCDYRKAVQELEMYINISRL